MSGGSMIAGLIAAADRAAAACDEVQTVAVALRGNGFVVMGRLELPHLGYTHELSVPYATVDLEPGALMFAVERMEQALTERRAAIPVFQVPPRETGNQPAVRVIERSDWSFWDQAVRAMAVLAIVVCIPLAGGLLP